MDAILRAAALYVFVWLLVRIAGKRTVSAMTTFDFVLLLMIGEATQQALLGNDFSMTNAFTVLGALLGIDMALSVIKQKFPRLDKWMDGTALIILENGRLLHERMNRERVDESDILEAARRLRGLERLDQIKYAILERSGGITIVPK